MHCSSYDCICLPEEDKENKIILPDSDLYCTELEVKDIIELSIGKSTKFVFYKQKLPNGRIIKSNSELIVPVMSWYRGVYKSRQTILLSNAIINQSFH
jgi:hypothetical protein